MTSFWILCYTFQCLKNDINNHLFIPFQFYHCFSCGKKLRIILVLGVGFLYRFINLYFFGDTFAITLLFMGFNWLQTLHECEAFLSQHDKASLRDTIPMDVVNCIKKFCDEVLTSMSDDLHTPVIFAALSDPLKYINDLLHTRKVLGFDRSIIKLHLWSRLLAPGYLKFNIHFKSFSVLGFEL